MFGGRGQGWVEKAKLWGTTRCGWVEMVKVWGNWLSFWTKDKGLVAMTKVWWITPGFGANS